MVLESILNPKIAEKFPWVTFFFGILYSSFSIFLAIYVLPGYVSLVIVFFTTLFFIPLFYNTIISEEKKDLDDFTDDERTLLKQHSNAIFFFMYLLLGLIISFAFWYVFFNKINLFGVNSEILFKSQLDTILQINGRATSPTIFLETKQTVSLFLLIFENNIKVMIFCILFSFIFGAGAIFILSWNSSVIGAAIGKYIIAFLSVTSGTLGSAYLKASSCGILRYLIHGIPEILAYFIAGLAGGIISVAIINHDFGTNKFEKIMIDAGTLIIVSIIIILISGLIEVGITPFLMCRF